MLPRRRAKHAKSKKRFFKFFNFFLLERINYSHCGGLVVGYRSRRKYLCDIFVSAFVGE